MVMDADTQLDDGFLAAAVSRFTDDRALMAVGGLFCGEEGHGLLGQFQRNEYIRYGRQIRRRRGRVFVLTGTASLFRPRALRIIAGQRGDSLPGNVGDVYDTAALTEDNELTIALKSLGALMISPSECTVVTELMPSWRTLWAQRLRWQRGALENIGAYGITPETMRYWAQQLGIGYGVIALSCYFVLLLLMVLSSDDWIWFPFWVGMGTVFIIERVATVWHGGWRARLLAVMLIPELFFDMFLNTVYVKGIIDISLGRTAKWKHLTHQSSRGDDVALRGAVLAGAAGFVLRQGRSDGLVEAIRRAGGSLLAPGVVERVRAGLPESPRDPGLDGLTALETDVLALIADGLSNRQIIEDLALTETTVKDHVSALLAKLGFGRSTRATGCSIRVRRIPSSERWRGGAVVVFFFGIARHWQPLPARVNGYIDDARMKHAA